MAIVLLMLCCAVMFEACCALMCCMVFVMYGRRLFSRVLAITERSKLGLYEVPMFMTLLGFGIGIMFAIFHVRGMM